MEWCRLTTDFYRDPALVRAGEAAEVLFLRCIAYSGEQESKGRIPVALLPMLAPNKTKARTAALLRERLLVLDGADVVIRSWDVHQEALDAEAERRKKDRDRKRFERAAARAAVLGLSEDGPADGPVDKAGTVRGFSARIEVEEEKEQPREPVAVAADIPREDVEKLCAHFLAAVSANGVKASITAKWRTEARLMLDKDKRDPHEIRAVIDWATQDSFWRANVLSVPTLREKYDRLRLNMGSRRAVGSGIASMPDEDYMAGGVFTEAMKRRQAREAGESA